MNPLAEYDDFIQLSDIGVLIKNTGIDVYDFSFRNNLDCKSITDAQASPIVLRIGAISDFEKIRYEVEQTGNRLLYSYDNYLNATDFERWYPLIADKTPRSIVYEMFPTLKNVLQDFSFPFFIKGNRQTNRHQRKLSIIENKEMFDTAREYWERDKILHWQKVVIREYVPLQLIDDMSFPDMIPISYEFRVFFWKKNLVGLAPYWTMVPDYSPKPSNPDISYISTLALDVSKKIDTPFLVVDVAKTINGDWIVIEVNDGQESGYARNNPTTLWRKIIQLEKK